MAGWQHFIQSQLLQRCTVSTCYFIFIPQGQHNTGWDSFYTLLTWLRSYKYEHAESSSISSVCNAQGWPPFRGMVGRGNVTVTIWVAGNSSSVLPCKVKWPILAGSRLLATAASTVMAPVTPSSPSLYTLTAQSFSITALPMDPGELPVCVYFYPRDNGDKLTVSYLFVSAGWRCCSRLPTGSSGTVLTERTSWRWQERPYSLWVLCNLCLT